MKKYLGSIIYYPQEAAKNQAFIQCFQKHGAQQGIHFEYKSIYEYQSCQDSGTSDFVLNRTRQSQVSRWYQDRHIPVFHRDTLVELSNDKYKSIQYFQKHLPDRMQKEKWCPDSWLLTREEMEKVCSGEKKLPEHMVIKSLDGHGGSEVFLTDKISSFSVLRGKDCLLQERIPSSSQDLRVYLLGGEIYQAVLRTGQQDFRSNFSLGGNVSAYELNGEQRNWIQHFADALLSQCPGMIGIDFIVSMDGRLFFNEVEEMVGCRMLYQCTSHDIVRDYVAWLGTLLFTVNGRRQPG